MNMETLGLYKLEALSWLVSEYLTTNNLNNKKIIDYLTESEGRCHCGALSVASLCFQISKSMLLFSLGWFFFCKTYYLMVKRFAWRSRHYIVTYVSFPVLFFYDFFTELKHSDVHTHVSRKKGGNGYGLG